MNEFNFVPEFDTTYADARQKVREALDDEVLLAYTKPTGVLGLGEVENERLLDTSFQEVVQYFAWPSQYEDGLLEPIREYASAKEFIDSLRKEDEFGLSHLGSSHFYMLISQRPIYDINDIPVITAAFGMYPVLHRAHAVAPELFDNLQVVLTTLNKRYSFISDKDWLYEEVTSAHNADIAESIYVAYQIMGRLVKIHDPSLVSAGSPGASRQVLLSADDTLRHGW